MAKIKSLQSSTGVSAGTVSTLALGGSGEINYIENPSDVTAGWTASGAGVTCTTYTTTADLPRQITEGTGIKLTGVSGSTAYMYYRFTLDRSDYGKKLKVVWDQAPISGYSASHFKVDVYSNTASDYTGTSTRLSLSTDSSSVTGIPNLTGSFRTTFDAPSSTAPYIEVRIGLNGAYTSSCVFSNIVVGPGIVTQGAAVSEWQSCTATFTNLAGTQTAVMRRIGDSMHLRAKSVLSGVAGGTMSIDIPSGYTHDTTKYNGASGTRVKVGTVTFWDATASATFNGDAVYIIGTGIRFYGPSNHTLWNATSPVGSASADEVVVDMVVPIAEWAGSGTVNVVQNDVEYISGVGSWGTSSAPTLVSSPAGSLGGTTTPAGTNFYYEFTPRTPITASTSMLIEISQDGIHWSPPGPASSGANADPIRFDGTNYIGLGIYNTNSGTCRAYFGKYSTGTSTAWTGTWYWRIKKFDSGSAVGFGLADSANSGLISRETTGTFTATVTGMSSTTTGTMRYTVTGKTVTLYCPGITGTSNTTSQCTITGLPSVITPQRQQDVLGTFTDNGSQGLALHQVTTSSTILANRFTAINSITGGVTGSGTKGFPAQTFTYSLD